MTNYKELFLLDPSISFLNFGSFGACPKPIFDEYQSLQRELEYQPVQFIVKTGMEKLKAARKALADFVNCDMDDVVFMTNPSFAINTIAKSLKFKAGNEILSTNLEYGALDRTWNYCCSQSGAKYIQQKINLPIKSKEQVLEDFWKGYSDKTKAIFISQITSATGLILPVKEICEEAKKRGLITIIDGAHVPGHILLNLSELKADIYTGACHKWMMSPKGASFLYVHKDLQNEIDPLVISWGYQSDFPSHSQFLDYHQTIGTRDYSAFLTVPKAIDFMAKNNWVEVAKECRKLCHENAERFCELLNTNTLAPLGDEFFGQMISLPINCSKPQELHDLLIDKYKIEVPLATGNNQVYLRYSINAFNDQSDLDRLFDALKDIMNKTDLIHIN